MLQNKEILVDEEGKNIKKKGLKLNHYKFLDGYKWESTLIE